MTAELKWYYLRQLRHAYVAGHFLVQFQSFLSSSMTDTAQGAIILTTQLQLQTSEIPDSSVVRTWVLTELIDANRSWEMTWWKTSDSQARDTYSRRPVLRISSMNCCYNTHNGSLYLPTAISDIHTLWFRIIYHTIDVYQPWYITCRQAIIT